jgi:capsular exopolysaccharide synthesis family protein
MDLGVGSKSLLDYGSVLWRRRWVIALALAAVTLVALVGSFVVTPQYRAVATLQIERHNPDILTFRDLAQADYSWAAYSDFYQTQYRIMSSQAVARLAVERLGLTHHPDFDPASAPGPGLLARALALIPRRKGPEVEISAEEVAAARLLAGVEVDPIRNSHLVKLAYVGTDPTLAADVANALAGSYIQYTIDSQYSTTGEAEGFLVDQIENLKREIGEIEERLQAYGEAKRIVSVDDANNITLQALKDVAVRRTEARTRLAAAEARYRAIAETEPIALDEVLHSDLIARLRQEYAGYEATYTEQARRFGDEWPELQTARSKLEQASRRLDAEIENIARQVRATAQAEYEGARREVENLERLLDGQEYDAQQLKRHAVEFSNLQAEVDTKRRTLDALLARRNEMTLSTRLRDLESTSTNIRIMERASPPAAPFRPNTVVNLAMGVMFGLALGVGMALLLDYLDNTLAGPAELERVTGLPVLAVVPRQTVPGGSSLKRLKGPVAAPEFDLASHLDPRSAPAEAYRELRTSLLLSHPGQPPRRIMITSALPEEGKTATTINLAIVLAQLGRRVLVVDTDLRRPRLHKPFDAENRQGVSTYLSGLSHDAAALAVPTAVPHLHLLSSGPIPPNPSELLNSERFREMAEELLAAGYDHLLFDSPPALSVSDPVVIAAAVESGILVVRAGRTPRQSVKLAAEKLRPVESARFGALLNDLDSDAGGARYAGYHYGRYEHGPEADAESASGTGG